MESSPQAFRHDARIVQNREDIYLPVEEDDPVMPDKKQNYTIRKNITAASAGFWGTREEMMV